MGKPVGILQEHHNLIYTELMILGSILFVIAGILGLILLVQHIMLLVKLFKHGGVGLGILGLCIGLFAFVWGWIKATEFGFKKLMIWYTIVMILCGLFYGAGSVAMFASPEFQQKLKEAQQQSMTQNSSTSEIQKTIEDSLKQNQR